jgi:flagellar protein FlaJ
VASGTFYRHLAQRFPDLRLRLAQARMYQTPEDYVQQTFVLSALITGAIVLLLFGFSRSPAVLLLAPVAMPILFTYFMHRAEANAAKIQRAISKEVVFAGRFLIIELESGVPLYKALQNIGENYETIGKYCEEVVQRVDLGTSMEEALNEAVQLAPSNDLRRIFWQILNSLKTGSEVGTALGSVVDQIVREQQISVKEYGRKLNPMAMFYMMIAIIVPSLGTIMLIVLGTFIGLNIGLLLLSIVLGIDLLVQFMFLTIIREQRPPVDL